MHTKRIKSIKYVGIEPTYDMTVEKYHNYILSNGIITHNSGKSSFAIMLAREWNQLLGIPFSPKHHMAYSNQQVQERIDNLPRFHPLVCVSGDTKVIIRTLKNPQQHYAKIQDLVGRFDFEVLSYSVLNGDFEFVKPKACIETIHQAKVFEVTLINGGKVIATREHQFLTLHGYKQLKDLIKGDEVIIYPKKNMTSKVSCIKSLRRHIPVYDIIGVPRNHNFIANGMLLHNCDESINFCSASEWAKVENRELRKKIAQVRTRHLFFILCWPMKVNKIEKSYLDSFVNYWIHIIKRGVGAIFVKDINPVTDSWRLSLFKDIGGFTEFTGIDKIKKKLSSHPNFWYIITAPKPSEEFYKRYLVIREKNIYNADGVLTNMTRQDVHKAIIVKVLQDIMIRDSSLSMKRLLLHIKNEYGFDMKESELRSVFNDSDMLIEKLKNEKYNLGTFKDENDWKIIAPEEADVDDGIE